VFCALFPRLCANATTVAQAVALLRPSRPARRRATRTDGGRSLHNARKRRPDISGLPDEPGVYLMRNAAGQVLYVGKSVSLRTRAAAHFAPSSPDTDWAGQAELVDHRPTNSELGALLLESRLIRQLRPPGNLRAKRDDRYVYLRCRFDIPYPILEVSPDPAPGHAVNVGPLQGRYAVIELMEQLTSLFALRHCGRRLVRRPWPSAYGQMGRCLSPCLGDLDPNLYRRRLDAALALFTGPSEGGAALLAEVDAQIAAAAGDQLYERAAWLRRRRERLAILLERVGGVLRATHSRPRLVLAEHPRGGRFDAFWLVGGRVADWGPLDAGARDLAGRTAAALRSDPAHHGATWLSPDEAADHRVVATWLASHETPQLDLVDADEATLERFAQRAGVA
jgi:DNA polymerase-3 subunit epsilon